MKIQLDEKHFLNSNEFCYWITATVNPKKGKPYERRVSGYTSTFIEAVESYIEKGVKSSVSESLYGLCRDINQLKAEVRAWQEVSA